VKPLTTAQARLLFVLQMGGFINQGNLVLVDSNYICVSYDRRSLRELINRNLIWVNPETMHWEERPKEDEEMNDEQYYKGRADSMCNLLSLLVDSHQNSSNHPTRNRLMRQAQNLVTQYMSREVNTDQLMFTKYAVSVGADPDWYGREVTMERVLRDKVITATYRVVGINRDRPKNKIMLVTARGRETWASPEFVAEHLGEELQGGETDRPGQRAIQL